MTYPLSTISEMCEEFGLTARALRFYEAKGLLSPVRTGQRRLYSKEQKARVKIIVRAKSYGFSLEQIREILTIIITSENHSDRASKIMVLAEEQIVTLMNKKSELDDSIAGLNEEISTGADFLSECDLKLSVA